MTGILDLCRDFPTSDLAAGQVLVSENTISDRLFVLVSGTIEVYRGDVTIALVSEPGAIFGEMSLLLESAHTANVRAITPATVHVIEEAAEHLAQAPELLFPIARLLARRLQNSTTYLVDLKNQFQDRSDHLAMVDEVLESMINQQDVRFTPGGDLPPDS